MRNKSIAPNLVDGGPPNRNQKKLSIFSGLPRRGRNNIVGRERLLFSHGRSTKSSSRVINHKQKNWRFFFFWEINRAFSEISVFDSVFCFD